MSSTERILFYLNFFAEIVLLWRLIHCHLYRTYRLLFWYWLLQALPSVALLSVGIQTYTYLYVYWGAQTINILMAVLVVQDLYRSALLEYPTLISLERRIMVAAMAIAALVALSGLPLDSTILPGHYPAIQRFLTFERIMNFVILVFLLLISGFLLWFPIKVRRNIVVYIFGFVLFRASRTFGVLLTNLRPQEATRLISTVLLALTLLCLLIWIVGIRPEGEQAIATPGYRRDPEDAQRLSRQLDAINGTLARFVRS